MTNVSQYIKFAFDRVEIIVGKRRNCWLFSPFSTMFSKGLFLEHQRSSLCVKGLLVSYLSNEAILGNFSG